MFKNYIKTAFRNIIRNKFISIINILGLGFGISVFLIILFYVNHEYNHDKFNQNYNNIYRIERVTESPYCGTPGMLGEMLTKVFPEIIAFNRMDSYSEYVINYKEDILNVEKVLLADSSFFNMFSYNILSGSKSDLLTKPFTIVFNKTTANKIFGNINPIGETVLLNNKYEFEVVGVLDDMPSNSHIQANALISIENLKTFYGDEKLFQHIGQWNYYTYLLTDNHVDSHELENKISAFLNEQFKKYRKDNEEVIFKLTSLKDIYFTNVRGYDYEKGNLIQIKLFLAIGIIVMFIAVINFINLTTTQHYNRVKELGVRKVMGSVKSKIVSQLIIESIVFSVIALNLSLVFIEVLKPLFNRFLNFNIQIGYFKNPEIIIYLICGGIFLGLLAGIFPSIHIANINPISALSKKVSHGKTGLLIRKVLIIIQFFIASSLIAATFIVIMQMNYIKNKELGFDKDQLIFLKLNSDIKAKKQAFKDELKQHSDIENVSYSYASYRIQSERWSNDDGEKSYSCHIERGDADYLETLGIELIEGRNFSKSGDVDLKKFIINETASKEIFNGNALGEEIFGAEIVGVVKDYSFETLHKPIEPLAIVNNPKYTSIINVRINGENWKNGIKYIEEKWNEFSPNFPFEFSFVNEYLDSKYRKEKQMSNLFILFSVISILIACLGLVGIISFTIQKRTKEIGIRKVNGANTFKILTIISSDLGSLVVIAFLFSVPVSWYLMNKWMQEFAFHINFPVWIYIVSFVVVIIITFLSIFYQSIKAARLNPVDTLRYE